MSHLRLVRPQEDGESTTVCVVQISAATEAYLRALVASAEEQETLQISPRAGKEQKRPRTLEEIAAEALADGVLSAVHRDTCRRAQPEQFGAFIPTAG